MPSVCVCGRCRGSSARGRTANVRALIVHASGGGGGCLCARARARARIGGRRDVAAQATRDRAQKWF